MSGRRTANRVETEGGEVEGGRRGNNNTRRVSQHRVSQREVDYIILCLRSVIREQNLLIGALSLQNERINEQNFTATRLGYWEYAEIYAVIDRVREEIGHHQGTLSDILRDLSEDTDDEFIVDEQVDLHRANQYMEDTVRAVRESRDREERLREARERQERREERHRRHEERRRLRRAVEVNGERRAHDVMEEGAGRHGDVVRNEIAVQVAQADERENDEERVDREGNHGLNYSGETSNK